MLSRSFSRFCNMRQSSNIQSHVRDMNAVNSLIARSHDKTYTTTTYRETHTRPSDYTTFPPFGHCYEYEFELMKK